jgi:hypothetical protein
MTFLRLIAGKPARLLILLSLFAIFPSGLYAQTQKMLGIGAIVDTVDYTTDSFNFFRYFQTHPIIIGVDTLRPTLVDRAGDAHFSVTGIVASEIKLRTTGDDSYFEAFHRADVDLWRDGEKLGQSFALCSANTKKTDKRPDRAFDDMRYATMANCFDQLRTQIASMLSQAEVKGRDQ